MPAIDTYLGSKELKKLIVDRSFELELPLKLICLEVAIDYKDFMQSYINSHENKNFTVSENKFEAVLNALGIKVRHQFIIDEKFDYKSKQDELREVFKKNNK